MASLRFSSFGAATVPLSKIIPDKDFDLRPYGITAAFARVPYQPIDWETEELDWGGIPTEVVVRDQLSVKSTVTTVDILTANTPIEVCVRVTVLSGAPLWSGAEVCVNGGHVFSLAGLTSGSSKTTQPLILMAGNVVTARLGSSQATGSSVRIELIYTGRVVGEKTFDLTGKWLALGIDMKGLDPTIKIHGVEIPYSDYVYCFPLAPTELTFSADSWSSMQERPIIKVYK